MPVLLSETDVYSFISVVDRGTFGQVATFQRQSDFKTVAIKTLRLSNANMLKRETRLLASLALENLEQSHIVHFFESFRDQDHQHLVFEVLDKNLYRFQADIGFRPLSIRDIRTITLQVLTALSKLKAIGIVHGDIKPENVMLVDQSQYPFQVKLIDFGSSYAINEADGLRVSYLQTRYYRAPEIVLGLPFCEKMDVWSLGCMTAELYLGHPLYPANSELELLHYMCETLGTLPAVLLNSASKAKYFFDPVKRRAGESQWKLKPILQRPSLTGKRSLRRHVVTSLARLEKGAPAAGFGREDAVEMFDRWCMVDLLKRMLALDALGRINAGQALRHPFVTLEHLRTYDGHHRYYDSSMQGYREASIPCRSSPDVPDRTLAPPGEIRSLRGSLRSFFARLCVMKRKKKQAGPRPASDRAEGQQALPGPREDSDAGFGAAGKKIESPPADAMPNTSRAARSEVEKRGQIKRR